MDTGDSFSLGLTLKLSSHMNKQFAFLIQWFLRVKKTDRPADKKKKVTENLINWIN